jgi:8-oxo-dGTP diphosphatase
MRQVYAHYDRLAEAAAGGFLYCPYCRTELVLRESGLRRRPTCPACGFIQFQNPAPTVSIVVADDDKVLLGKRTGLPGQGKWAFPSGYIEHDDDFLTAGLREVKEETRLDVGIEAIIHVLSSFLTPRWHFFSVFLLARPMGGELAAGDDLEAVAWFSPSDALPEMAFQEDVDVLEAFWSGQLAQLPVDPEFSARAS